MRGFRKVEMVAYMLTDAKGMDDEQVAQEMNVPIYRVRNMRKNVRDKYRYQDRYAANRPIATGAQVA